MDMKDKNIYDPESQTLDGLQLEDDLEDMGVDTDIAALMAWQLKDF